MFSNICIQKSDGIPVSDIFISIVIPTFNAEKTIYRCLKSIFENKPLVQKSEIIVVDNNSSDETELVVKNFDVAYVKELKQGRSYARNAGLKVSRGQLIAFIDADVVIELDWIEKMSEIVSLSGVGGASCSIEPSNNDSQYLLNWFRRRVVSQQTAGSFNLLNVVCPFSPMINSAACMYSREALTDVGGFDVCLSRHEDIDLSKRVSGAGYHLVGVDYAKAYVSYHDVGWVSYFLRTFRDGFTKNRYLYKHRLKYKIIDLNENKRVKENQVLDSLILINIALTKSLLQVIFKLSLFHLIVFLNNCVQILGRIAGKIAVMLNPPSIDVAIKSAEGVVSYVVLTRAIIIVNHCVKTINVTKDIVLNESVRRSLCPEICRVFDSRLVLDEEKKNELVKKINRNDKW